MGTARVTYIIDENGVISEVIEKVDTKNHASQILKDSASSVAKSSKAAPKKAAPKKIAKPKKVVPKKKAVKKKK